MVTNNFGTKELSEQLLLGVSSLRTSVGNVNLDLGTAQLSDSLASFINLDSLKGSDDRAAATASAAADASRNSGGVPSMLSRETRFKDIAPQRQRLNVGGDLSYTTVSMDQLFSMEEKAQMSALLSSRSSSTSLAHAPETEAAAAASTRPYRAWGGGGGRSSSSKTAHSLSLGSAAAALDALSATSKQSRHPTMGRTSPPLPPPSSSSSTARSGSGRGYLSILQSLGPVPASDCSSAPAAAPRAATTAASSFIARVSTSAEMQAIERSLLDGAARSGLTGRTTLLYGGIVAAILFYVFFVHLSWDTHWHLVLDIGI